MDPDSTKITLFFIDSRKEIKTGVGLNFPPIALNADEVQINRGIATALSLSEGDKVAFHMDLKNLAPGLFNKFVLLSLMTAEADFVVTDPENQRLIFDDGFVLPLSWLNESEEEGDDDWKFEYEFSVR